MTMTVTGNCFEVAAELALSEQLTLVHGLPVGQSGPPRGKRYWHAWVERTEVVPLNGRPVELAWVFDLSNGKAIAMPRALYYQLGQLHLEPERWTWRYSPDQAAEHMQTLGTYGPWVEHWETLADER